MEESEDTHSVTIQQIRADYFKELAIEHHLTIEEIQKIHEETLTKLTKTESKGAMFMNIAFPAAIKNYIEKRD
jgi:hypothetical protein